MSKSSSVRAALLAVLLSAPALQAQTASAPAKYGFFGSASLVTTSPVTLTQPPGSPFGVPEPRYEIGTGGRGVGGEVLVGLAVNRFGLFGTMGFVGSRFHNNSADRSFGGGQFMADVGARYDFPFFSRAVNPYVIGSFGYYDLSYKTGDPTIIIGPGGGYDSGTVLYDGTALSYGVGVELASRLIASGKAARRVDLRIVGARVSFGGDYPPESVTTLRMQLGMTWWVRKGLI